MRSDKMTRQVTKGEKNIQMKKRKKEKENMRKGERERKKEEKGRKGASRLGVGGGRMR